MYRREFLMCLLATCVPSVMVRADQSLPLSDDELSAAEADTRFTLDLYRRLASNSDDNIILSGHSVMAAFMVLAEGTSGTTAGQIGNTFHLPEWAARPNHNLPWDFTKYSRAFAELQRSMEPTGAEESAALQERLNELTTQLQRINNELDGTDGQNFFDLLEQSEALRLEIGEVSQQIDPYQLRFANAVWCDLGFPLRNEYASTVADIWGAATFGCDFQRRPNDERVTINDWVASQTEGRIEDLLAPDTIDALTRLVITNAVYFKGNWQSTFDVSFTQDQPFYLANGTEVVAPLMADWNRECRYVELTADGDINEFQRTDEGWQLPENPDGFKLLELPYRGGKLSMMVLLPNQTDGLADIEARLDSETLANWQAAMRMQEVEVFLPRFTLTREYVLNDTLKALGLTAVFQAGGLTRLSDSPEVAELYVSLVAQKAFIEVNEEGTEAAAATAIVAMRGAIAEPKPNPTFRADHPFLYFIQDVESGAILFMGRLTSPE